MWRLSILLLIVGSFLYGQEYTPLTREEAIAYIDNPDNREQLIQDIINLDVIEHTTPVIRVPQYGASLLDTGDLIVFPIDKKRIISLAHLRYEVGLPTFNFKRFHMEEDRSQFIPGLVGFGIGCLGGLLIGIFGE